MTTKSTTARPTASPQPTAPTRKRNKVARHVTTKPTAKHAHAITSAERAVAFVSSRQIKSLIANTVRREIARQLRVIDATQAEAVRGNKALQAVHAYAREVFGSAAKANRWLERPSSHLGGESPVAWLQNHDDPSDVYSALDAIPYGTPI